MLLVLVLFLLLVVLFLQHGRKYVMVSEQRLLGIYVLVMATEAVCTKIANVQSAMIPTGLGVSGTNHPCFTPYTP